VIAVLVTVLGALLVLDALAAADLMTALAWTPRALAGLDGLTPGSWALPAGLLAAVVGLASPSTAEEPVEGPPATAPTPPATAPTPTRAAASIA
jgi:hypothetical protein